uniref:hypothetical protein n=1 Tax=Eisenbergiella tayi TaxID=1432052 RepID=UPI003FD6C9F8
MEKELLERGPVLDEKGRPIPGYSRRSTLVYDRKQSRLRHGESKNGIFTRFPMTGCAFSLPSAMPHMRAR